MKIDDLLSTKWKTGTCRGCGDGPNISVRVVDGYCCDPCKERNYVEDVRIDIENGKYTFIVREVSHAYKPGEVEIAILRHGEEWMVDGRAVYKDGSREYHEVFPWKAIHSLLWDYQRLINSK